MALAAVAPAAERAQLLILDLDASDVEASKVAILNGRIASLISQRDDIEALTASDVQAMAKLDASKAAMGCEESSCLAEIANAMGAKYVVYGRVGKLDETIFLQLNLFDAAIGKPISRQEAQAAKLQELSAKMPDVMTALLRPLGGKAMPADAVVEKPSVFTSPLFITGAGVAVVGAVVGVSCSVVALGMNGDLESTTSTLEQKQNAYDYGAIVASLGIGGVVVGVAGVVVAGIALAE